MGSGLTLLTPNLPLLVVARSTLNIRCYIDYPEALVKHVVVPYTIRFEVYLELSQRLEYDSDVPCYFVAGSATALALVRPSCLKPYQWYQPDHNSNRVM